MIKLTDQVLAHDHYAQDIYWWLVLQQTYYKTTNQQEPTHWQVLHQPLTTNDQPTNKCSTDHHQPTTSPLSSAPVNHWLTNRPSIFFFYLGFLLRPFTNHRTAGEGEGISLTPHYHFHPLHRHLDISRAITAESSPLHIASSQTRTR